MRLRRERERRTSQETSDQARSTQGWVYTRLLLLGDRCLVNLGEHSVLRTDCPAHFPPAPLAVRDESGP